MAFGDDVYNEDTLYDAANKMLNAHNAGNMVVACCTCTVEYDGTVKTSVEAEQRTVMLKPDGSLLVHDSEGVDPLNWQKSNADIKLQMDDAELIIEATRNSSDDVLTITCYDVHKSIHYTPADEDLDITGTEEDMHAAILEEPSLVEEGLTDVEHEKETSAGDIDIYAQDSNGTPLIIEVKRRTAQLKHVDQVSRYVGELQKEYDTVRGVLVAPSISDSAKELLEDKGYEFCSLDPLDISS